MPSTSTIPNEGTATRALVQRSKRGNRNQSEGTAIFLLQEVAVPWTFECRKKKKKNSPRSHGGTEKDRERNGAGKGRINHGVHGGRKETEKRREE